MANMFTETRIHNSPKSLEDCTKTDKVTDNLWIWASRIETFGEILLVLIVLYGIISAIVASVSDMHATNSGFPVGTFLLRLLTGALWAFIEYCAYHVIALLVGSLASIVEHTRISARLLEYRELKDNVTTDPAEINKIETALTNNRKPGKDEWKCPNCGKINANYVGTCGCGTSKSESNNAPTKKKCNACGRMIPINATFCDKCGHHQE